MRYEPDFRLQLGRVGVDPEANLTAAHQMYGELEAYLSRIYAKTGCRNRVDLARRFAGTPA